MRAAGTTRDRDAGAWAVSPQAAQTPDSRAGRTVAVLIGLNLAVQVVLTVVAIATDMDLVGIVRLSLGAGVAVYAASAVWVLARSGSLGLRPRLGLDTALVGAAEGFVVGGGLALLIAAVLRLALGRPALDPTAGLLAADGALGPLLLGGLLLVVVAPVVEELVFRGFLAEAFRHKGAREAVAVSAVAFGLAHLQLAQFRYYLFLGVVLGVVYLRRGLLGSVCAHAAFNGMLLVVAVAATHGPAVEAAGAGARLVLPAGWTTEAAGPGEDLVAIGPAGTRVEMAHGQVPPDLASVELLARAVTSGSGPVPRHVSVDPSTVVVLDLPAGRAVSATTDVDGRRGRLVLLPTQSRLWVLGMISEGSSRDSRDFDAILRSWRLPA